MNNQDRENWSRFYNSLCAIAPDEMHWRQLGEDTNRLHRLNMRLHTLSERSCNGDGWYPSGATHYQHWEDSDEQKFVRLWDNTMAKVKAIFAQYGDFEVKEQGDPRGWGMFEATHKPTGRVFRINW